MQVVDALLPNAQTLICLASSEGIETFSPTVFAACCSRNALVCLKRLAQYKPLIGVEFCRRSLSESSLRFSWDLFAERPESRLRRCPQR